MQYKSLRDLIRGTHVHIFNVLGPPSSGKTFLANLVQEASGVPIIDTSALIARHIAGGGPLAQVFEQVKSLVRQGKLCPNAPTMEAFGLEIRDLASKGARKVIMVGFPRNKEQLFAYLGGNPDFLAFLFEMSREQCYDRLLQKLGDRPTREDDDKFDQRYEVFRDMTLPVYAHLKRHHAGNCKLIPGTNGCRKKFADIVREMNFPRNEHRRIMNILGSPNHPVTKKIIEREEMDKRIRESEMLAA